MPDRSLAVALGVALAAVFPGTPTCAAAAPPREDRAGLEEFRVHLERLTQPGPHPSGTNAARTVAEYLTATMQGLGYDVRVQEGIARSAAAATSGRVRNVVALLPATGATTGPAANAARDAVLLCAHYDSTPDGPGAADNAASVAALLAAAARLAAEPERARAAVFLFTDGEERHLLGAELFAREDPLAGRIAAVFNFDNAGRRPPLFNFEAAPGSRALQQALWSLPDSPGAPRSFSFATDVYRVLPFDTDFTALRSLGVPGLNFGFALDGYAYHNRRDRADDVPDASLRALGGTARNLVDAFVVRGASLGAGAPARNHAAFAPLGSRIVRLDPGAILLLAAFGVLAAAWAILRALRRHRGVMVRALFAPVLALPVAFALLAATVAVMRAIKGVSQVGYAHPLPFFLLLSAVGGVAVMVSATMLRGGRLPAGARLAAGLAPWAVLAVLTALLLPSSSLFFVVPLAVVAPAAIWLAARPGAAPRAVAAVAVVASLAAAWAEPLSALLPFLMTTLPKSGPEPLLIWPGVFALLAALIGPLGWALCAPSAAPVENTPGAQPLRGRSRGTWLASGAAVAVTAAATIATPAYDAAHPRRVHRYHLTAADRAQEVVASTEKLPRPGGGAAWNEPPIDPLRRVIPGWPSRARESLVRAPLPQVRVARGTDSVVVEVTTVAGTDAVYLTVEGVALTGSDPPSERRGPGRMSLRQIVAGESGARFHLFGKIPAGTRMLVSAVTARLTAGVDGEAMIQAPADALVFVDRSIAYVEVRVE